MSHWTNDHLDDEFPPPRLVSFTITHLVIVIFLTFTIGWLVGELTASPERVDPKSQVVTEDDPRWDCTTMGNQTCGLPKATPAQDKANAYNYAQWCHGYVQTTKDEHVVVGCDR